jgi:hypothetical protein
LLVHNPKTIVDRDFHWREAPSARTHGRTVDVNRYDVHPSSRAGHLDIQLDRLSDLTSVAIQQGIVRRDREAGP